MEGTTKTRSPALDMIRIFALFCVVSLHYFLFSGFYVLPVIGWKFYLATLARTLFMICVPLFLLLTGYLMRRKTATKAYYLKLIRIIGEYLLASLFCMASIAVHHGNGFGDIVRSFLLQVTGLFSFEAAEYSWYVEMYIGLFLLIPYLNVLYSGLQSRQAKQRLIFTMLLLSGIPEILNGATFSLPWEMTYNDPSNGLTLFPNHWNSVYPITYYFIGAYLNEYPLQLSKAKTAALLIVSNIFAGTINYIASEGNLFNWGSWQTHESLLTVTQAVLVFSFFLQLDTRRIGAGSQKFLALLSDLTFSAYLVSSVFDKLFYRLAGMRSGDPVFRPSLYFLMVPLILFCSLVAAFILVSIYKLLQKLILQTVQHFRESGNVV